MLYRDLDVRIAVSCSPHDTDTRGVAEVKEIAEEMCRGISLRSVSSYRLSCSLLYVAVYTLPACIEILQTSLSTSHICVCVLQWCKQ